MRKRSIIEDSEMINNRADITVAAVLEKGTCIEVD